MSNPQNRHEDSLRLSNPYGDLVNRAIEEGKLKSDYSNEDLNAYLNKLVNDGKLYSNPESKLIGDDLTDEQLNYLWEHLSGKPDGYFGWWDDKPHQVAYRLLLRMTRAENILAEGTFHWALEQMKLGKYVRTASQRKYNTSYTIYNEDGQVYLVNNKTGCYVEEHFNGDDLLATDWELVEVEYGQDDQNEVTECDWDLDKLDWGI